MEMSPHFDCGIPIASLDLPPSSAPNSPLDLEESSLTEISDSEESETALHTASTSVPQHLPMTPVHRRSLSPTTPLQTQRSDLSTDHVIPMTPIRGRTRAERSANRKASNMRQREHDRATRDAEKVRARAQGQRQAEEEWIRVEQVKQQTQAQAEEARRTEELAAQQAKVQKIRDVLHMMHMQDVTYGDILEYLVDAAPSEGYGWAWYDGLFGVDGRVEKILQHWVSGRNSKTGWNTVRKWAIEYVSELLDREGNTVTKDSLLLASRRAVDASFANDFHLSDIHARIRELCPCTVKILEALATTTRQ